MFGRCTAYALQHVLRAPPVAGRMRWALHPQNRSRTPNRYPTDTTQRHKKYGARSGLSHGTPAGMWTQRSRRPTCHTATQADRDNAARHSSLAEMTLLPLVDFSLPGPSPRAVLPRVATRPSRQVLRPQSHWPMHRGHPTSPRWPSTSCPQGPEIPTFPPRSLHPPHHPRPVPPSVCLGIRVPAEPPP